jgi:A/G-specific adenine glycosylase
VDLKTAQSELLAWYRQNKRDLPWRANRDPYSIWISETMLQQTTTTAVIPFFEKFLKRFPTLQSLAEAPQSEVVETWAGLGYYSRARNLHKSAQALRQNGGFPKTFEQLMQLPGFGPYTSRSVASLAFSQNVGVVDGNVIRVLARFHAQNWDWWQNRERKVIQEKSDEWVQGQPSHEMNQALMELGRTICRVKSPTCLLCPLRTGCEALRRELVGDLPKSKPKRLREIWQWQPFIHIKAEKILLQKNNVAPFLRGQWLLPARARRLTCKPKAFDYKHSITHHDIFVTVQATLPKMADAETKWVRLEEIRQHVPVSLVQKALALRTNDVRGDIKSGRPERVQIGQLKKRRPSRSR